MPTDVIPDSAMLAWRRFLVAHCAIQREMDAELRAEHGMTINDYDALVQLSSAADRRLRMSALADHVVLTRSGMTRLVDGLVREGLVERVSCGEDARVSYAQLTDQGAERLAAARCTHHRGIRRAFSDHFSEAELDQLASLLGKLPSAALPGCCVPRTSASQGLAQS